MSDEQDITEAIRLMKLLNNKGADVMKKYNIRGATDITGFGLAGHALKMARSSNVSLNLNMNEVPLIGKTYDLADEGCIPGASFRNLEYAEKDSDFGSGMDYNLKMIAFDAQTSGGLLMCASQDSTDRILDELKGAGLTSAAVIGNVREPGEKLVYLYC
jgi:selenide, water dikinase